MPILNRAPPNRTRFYVESTNVKALTIRKLGHFTAHIYCQQIKAVCGFRCWASKHTPFFHTISTIVAIFLAKVSRAISGLMPLANKAA